LDLRSSILLDVGCRQIEASFTFRWDVAGAFDAARLPRAVASWSHSAIRNPLQHEPLITHMIQSNRRHTDPHSN